MTLLNYREQWDGIWNAENAKSHVILDEISCRFNKLAARVISVPLIEDWTEWTNRAYEIESLTFNSYPYRTNICEADMGGGYRMERFHQPHEYLSDKDDC